MTNRIVAMTAAACADEIVRLATAAVRARGTAVVVLAGGTTPLPVYRALAERVADGRADLTRWTVLCSDERCLPVGHPERNDTAVRRLLVDPAAVGRFVPIPAERGPEAGAAALAGVLASVGRIDVAVLGVGDDGHTASLFTEAHLDEEADAVAVTDAPKPPPARVSIGASRLRASRSIRLLVGADKRAVVARIARGDDLPVVRVAPRATIIELDGA